MRSFNWLSEWGVLPEPGGLLLQPKVWIEDMELALALQGQVRREYELWKKAQGNQNAGQ